MKTAVVGAGWAGLAAATALREAGCDVTVYEAGHTPGGRARRVPGTKDDFAMALDNGQHILLGAYTETLALMRRLGRDPGALLLRQPLRLAALNNRFRLSAPRLPAPWHTAVALLGARGLGWRDRLACVRMMRSLRASNWRTARGETVADLLQRHRQPPGPVRWLWEPLCLAALNTPIAQACAQLYANVLRDSLGGPGNATDILLPRVDMSALWPDEAARRCRMRYGHAVRRVDPGGAGVAVDGERYDAAVIAVPPAAAARLLRRGAAGDLAAGLGTMAHGPIATLTLQLAAPWALPEPMMMLAESPARGHDGQWVFDRAALAGRVGRPAELSVVVSAATALAARGRDAAIAAIVEQLREQALQGGLPPMPAVMRATLLVDKRAAFMALPGLWRPPQATAWRALALAGDWTDTGYPGVLEGAVRSGLRAAAAILEKAPGA
ncbi:amine oxidoreductase [Bordetella genomosp. 9]|uniref:hydroxysqualene dehydroxylase HpnE n=1 Tax=Bordetella genomosp. 9 TaxID=1416803 RepID=UPI000A2918EB|nr:hydroxysqualene dehydroxylase HpnE [Bordetella genomosp. 9]ARP90090.1 amine oxidoreductase [Bordetella genomosp. 9]